MRTCHSSRRRSLEDLGVADAPAVVGLHGGPGNSAAVYGLAFRMLDPSGPRE